MEKLNTLHVEEAYVAYKSKVENYAYFKTRNRIAAEEICAQVFSKITSMIGKMELKDDLIKYIYGATRNTIVDYYRKNAKDLVLKGTDVSESAHPVDLNSPFAVVCQKEKCMYIQSAVDQLPEAYRTVVRLRFFEEKSLKEISDELNLPLGTIKNKLYKAKRLLKKWLSRKQE